MFKPQYLSLINSNPTVRVDFDQTGYVRFCERMHGYNKEVTKEFSLNFDEDEVKVGKLKFIVTKATIASATKIPLEREKWFKGMPL